MGITIGTNLSVGQGREALQSNTPHTQSKDASRSVDEFVISHVNNHQSFAELQQSDTELLLADSDTCCECLYNSCDKNSCGDDKKDDAGILA